MTSAASDPAQDVSSSDTLTDRAITLVQRDILAGALTPGARLRIVELVERYEIGATPLREALSRLVSRGLIMAIGQRGFRVASVSRDDLLDITRVRVLVEMEALRLSIDHRADTWEAGILASLHRLRRYVERQGETFGEGTEEFDTLHKAFHSSLISGCGSPRLIEAVSNLYDQAYRYRRVMMRSFSDPGRFIRSHQNLADSVLSQDFAAAGEALSSHLRATLEIVYPQVPK